MRTFIFIIGITFALFGCQIVDGQAQTMEQVTGKSGSDEPLMSLPGQDRDAPGSAAGGQRDLRNGGPVSLTVSPQYGRLVADQQHTLNVLLRLTADGIGSTVRPPLHLALVLDTSGSMSGPKLRDVKAAAISLLKRLDGRDRVTLLSYSSHVSRLAIRRPMDDTGRAELIHHIIGLRAGGSTALGPAMLDAFSILREDTLHPLMLRHAILMSDGLANVGERDPRRLGAQAQSAFHQGVSLSTMGVGLNYNEDLMTKVADMGGGRYHFIQDSAKITSVLNDELNGLVATVARDVRVDVRPMNGVRLEKVFGYPVRRGGSKVGVQIGFMGHKQTREVMMRFVVDAGHINLDRAVLASFRMTYTDVVSDGKTRQAHGSLVVDHAASTAEQRASENPRVTIRLAEVESSTQLDIAARSISNGDFGAARQVMNRAIRRLKRDNAVAPSPRLNQQIQEFEDAVADMDLSIGSASARKRVTKKYKAKAYLKTK
ncbi:MAG: VWA domain-containing protein [Myxococcota bacterium]|nr:VWA domain-containing protein [Myxococcota bacterium]